MLIAAPVALLLFFSPQADQRRPAPAAQTAPANPAAPKPPEKPQKPEPEKPEEPPVVTHHSIQLHGQTINYTATTGMLPIRDPQGTLEAHMFFVAYTLDGVENSAHRTLTFAFNGGPGSSSVWLDMGAIGPRRVRMLDYGGMPPAPYHLEDNQETWLDQTDLVFIDPVGTGYSRAVRPDLNKKFQGVKGDIESVGEFIRLYLTRYERWSSPLFLAGESYGTTRAAGLAGHLIEQGIAFNGVILISTILNFQTVSFAEGNDLAPVLHLPSYTAIAWYHKRLPADLQADLMTTLHQVETFASGEYLHALEQGDRLPAAERERVADQLVRFTGLPKTFIEDNDLRIEIQHFTRELLRSQHLTVGRIDGRITGPSPRNTGEFPEFDPSIAAVRPPYTQLWGEYVRKDLGYKTDRHYYILGGGVTGWDWGRQNRYAETATALRSAFAKNPYMKLFVGAGYFDLATPYYAAEYTLNHMGLDPAMHGNVTMAFYRAGHMFYIDTQMLDKLRHDVGAFMRAAIPAGT